MYDNTLHGKFRGTNTRPFSAPPKVRVLRGFSPDTPHMLSQAFPIKGTEQILSGQVIWAEWIDANTAVWTRTKPATNAGVPYIAYQDFNEEVVQESGVLTGFSCAGQFELMTGWFDSTVSYPLGATVYADPANTGKITTASTGGAVKVGFVSRPAPFNYANNSVWQLQNGAAYRANSYWPDVQLTGEITPEASGTSDFQYNDNADAGIKPMPVGGIANLAINNGAGGSVTPTKFGYVELPDGNVLIGKAEATTTSDADILREATEAIEEYWESHRIVFANYFNDATTTADKSQMVTITLNA